MKFLDEPQTPVLERLRNPAPKPTVQEDKTEKAIQLLTKVVGQLVDMKQQEVSPKKDQDDQTTEVMASIKMAIADLAKATRERQKSPGWVFKLVRDRDGMIYTIDAERKHYS
jgi:hypothetical protein